MSGTQTGTGPRLEAIDRARDLFGLGPRPDRDEILAAWRTAVRLTHPDAVGTERHAAAERLMQSINESRDILLEAAAEGLLEPIRPNPGIDREPAAPPASPVLRAALEAAKPVEVPPAQAPEQSVADDRSGITPAGSHPPLLLPPLPPWHHLATDRFGGGRRAPMDGTGPPPRLSDAVASYAHMPKARARPVPATRPLFVPREQILVATSVDVDTSVARDTTRAVPWPLLTSAAFIALVVLAAVFVVLT
ncbi:MAG: hypothetical protein IT198_07950 [Acidimicrobiia bacterium]|nr:hypothetical protein [Acidimicrobiia bacterium]